MSPDGASRETVDRHGHGSHTTCIDRKPAPMSRGFKNRRLGRKRRLKLELAGLAGAATVPSTSLPDMTKPGFTFLLPLPLPRLCRDCWWHCLCRRVPPTAARCKHFTCFSFGVAFGCVMLCSTACECFSGCIQPLSECFSELLAKAWTAAASGRWQQEQVLFRSLQQL